MGRGLLIIVSGLFIVYGIIQNNLNQRQSSITQFSATYAEKTKAETIANTMADMAFAEINNAPTDTAAGRFSQTEVLGGTGSVSLRRERPFASEGNPFVVHKILTARGTYQGETVEIEVRTRRREFSRYSYFTVIEPIIYFTDGDVLNGPVHTNGTIHVNGDAEFNGPVTAANGCDGCSSHDPDFNGEKDLNADEIDLPVEVPELAQEASANGLRFTDDKVKVEFKNDGTANITNYQQTGSQTKCVERTYWGYCTETKDFPVYSETGSTQNYDLQDPSFNGIISASEKMEVEGTLNGDVTLHSEKDVEIMGDVRYDHLENPPENPDPAKEDFLGIVSEGHTIVDKEAHETDGSEDLDIHASIMALAEDGSFYVEDYDEGSERGQLNLLGGLIQYERGAVGTSANTGYLKNYTYDERFLGRAPRGFPPSDIYDFVSWKVKHPNEQ